MSKRKGKNVTVSKTYYIDKINELSTEIRELEDQCEQEESNLVQRFSNKTLDEIVNKVSQASSINYKGYSEEINSLLVIKGKLETLTGFVFEDDSVSYNSKTNCWRRLLTGKCLDLSFEIDFITEESKGSSVQEEVQQEKSQCHVKVSKLRVKLDDPLAQNELKTYISNAEQEKALGTMFQVFAQYSHCHNCRCKTFHHFNTKYPEFICFLNGPKWSNFMEVRNTQRNGLHFTICWNIHVDKFGDVVPQIDAFVCSSVEIEGAADIIDSTPEQFRNILSQCGIEEAIELLITIVQE